MIQTRGCSPQKALRGNGGDQAPCPQCVTMGDATTVPGLRGCRGSGRPPQTTLSSPGVPVLPSPPPCIWLQGAGAGATTALRQGRHCWWHQPLSAWARLGFGTTGPSPRPRDRFGLGGAGDKCCTSRCPRLCPGTVPKCYVGYGRARPDRGHGMETCVPARAIGTLWISAAAGGHGAAKGTAAPGEPSLPRRDPRGETHNRRQPEPETA